MIPSRETVSFIAVILLLVNYRSLIFFFLFHLNLCFSLFTFSELEFWFIYHDSLISFVRVLVWLGFWILPFCSFLCFYLFNCSDFWLYCKNHCMIWFGFGLPSLSSARSMPRLRRLCKQLNCWLSISRALKTRLAFLRSENFVYLWIYIHLYFLVPFWSWLLDLSPLFEYDINVYLWILQESAISSLKEWLADPGIGNNSILRLIAGIIFMHEHDYNEALKHTNAGGTMEL